MGSTTELVPVCISARLLVANSPCSSVVLVHRFLRIGSSVATNHTRGWAADSAHARVHLKARVVQLEQHVPCLREKMQIKDARVASISPRKRPQYAPTER